MMRSHRNDEQENKRHTKKLLFVEDTARQTTATAITLRYIIIIVIMKTAATLLCLSALSGIATAATELSVTVYEGPKECDEANTVKVGDYLHMHYTGTIDESSETGEKGLKFDSSRDRGNTFDFKIGMGMVIKGTRDLDGCE